MTPLNETDHDATASHCLLLVICVSLIAVLLPVAQHSAWIATLNESIHQFCLSCRTQDFDAFFIIVRLDMSSLALVSFGLAIIVYATYHRDWRLLRFWVSLILTTALIASALSQILIHKTSTAVLSGSSLLTFPLNGLVFATALFSFLMYYMAKFYHQTISVILRALLLSALLISGIALIYLGEDAFMNVILAYLISFSNALTHWIFYRRRGKPHYRSYLPITLSILFLIIATGVSSALFFDKIAARQQPHTQQFVIHHHAWWNQQRPLLPLYSTNRFGKKNALMNIQFSGSIKTLQQSLEQAGWQRQRDSLFNSLMQRITHQKTFAPLPLMAQLYLNKKPELLMVNTLSPEKNGLIIRFWRSNFHLLNHSQVIWIGSIQRQNHHHQTDPLDPIDALSSTLTDYRLKKVQFNLKSQLAPDKGITPLLLIERIN